MGSRASIPENFDLPAHYYQKPSPNPVRITKENTPSTEETEITVSQSLRSQNNQRPESLPNSEKEYYEKIKNPLVPKEDVLLMEKIGNVFGDESASKPWLFSRKFFTSKKWVQHEKFSSLEMTKEDKNGFDEVYDFVSYLWDRNAAEKFNITKIVAIKNQTLQQIWERQFGNLEIRKNQPNFKINWHKHGNIRNRQLILDRLTKYILHSSDNIYVMPVFHAPSPDAVQSICETGFAVFGSTDDGFFGKGIYGTPQSDYSVKVYGKGVCILCFVCFFNPFPVVRSDDLLGAGNVGKADVHFVSVNPISSDPEEKVFLPSVEGQEPVYDEIVVFQESQIIPRYVIYYETPEK